MVVIISKKTNHNIIPGNAGISVFLPMGFPTARRQSGLHGNDDNNVLCNISTRHSCLKFYL